MAVGVLVGVVVGELVGVAVGETVGELVAELVGVFVAEFVGVPDGVLVGLLVAVLVGVPDGVLVGEFVAVLVGPAGTGVLVAAGEVGELPHPCPIIQTPTNKNNGVNQIKRFIFHTSKEFNGIKVFARAID